MFGDQLQSNIIWWPNMLILKWVSKRFKHVWSNTDQTIDTSRWASVVRMPASNMFDKRLSKRTKHRPSNTRTKGKFLIKCLMALKLYQTRPSTIKHGQTRSNSTKQGPNGKMFGHQTIFDGVWSPNISRLSLGPGQTGVGYFISVAMQPFSLS